MEKVNISAYSGSPVEPAHAAAEQSLSPGCPTSPPPAPAHPALWNLDSQEPRRLPVALPLQPPAKESTILAVKARVAETARGNIAKHSNNNSGEPRICARVTPRVVEPARTQDARQTITAAREHQRATGARVLLGTLPPAMQPKGTMATTSTSTPKP